METRREWKTLVYMEEELGGERAFLDGARAWSGIALAGLSRAEELLRIPAREQALLVSPRAATLALARALGIASVACELPAFAGEELSGEPMVVRRMEELDREFFLRRYQRFHGIPWVIAETPRCTIRELSLDDLPALFALYGRLSPSEDVEPLLPYEREVEKERAYIAHMYRLYEFGMWLVFERRTGELIGRAGLEWMKTEDGQRTPRVELGYAVAPECRRMGYAYEVCRKILEYASGTLGIMDIYLRAAPDNAASLGLARKLGFEEHAAPGILYKKLR